MTPEVTPEVTPATVSQDCRSLGSSSIEPARNGEQSSDRHT